MLNVTLFPHSAGYGINALKYCQIDQYNPWSCRAQRASQTWALTWNYWPTCLREHLNLLSITWNIKNHPTLPKSTDFFSNKTLLDFFLDNHDHFLFRSFRISQALMLRQPPGNVPPHKPDVYHC